MEMREHVHCRVCGAVMEDLAGHQHARDIPPARQVTLVQWAIVVGLFALLGLLFFSGVWVMAIDLVSDRAAQWIVP